MKSNKKWRAVLIVATFVIVAVILAIGSGESKAGSKNAIEVNGNNEKPSTPSVKSKFEKELNPLVEEGYLDSSIKDTVLDAVDKYESEQTNSVSVPTETAPPNQSLTLTVLRAKGYITEEVFGLIKDAVDKSKADKRELKFKPLVATGFFKDTEEAEKLYKSFNKQLGALTVSQKEIVMKEIESANPPLDDAEKKQRREAFNADRDKRITEVLTAMVTAKEISEEQAESLRTFVAVD